MMMVPMMVSADGSTCYGGGAAAAAPTMPMMGNPFIMPQPFMMPHVPQHHGMQQQQYQQQHQQQQYQQQYQQQLQLQQQQHPPVNFMGYSMAPQGQQCPPQSYLQGMSTHGVTSASPANVTVAAGIPMSGTTMDQTHHPNHPQFNMSMMMPGHGGGYLMPSQAMMSAPQDHHAVPTMTTAPTTTITTTGPSSQTMRLPSEQPSGVEVGNMSGPVVGDVTSTTNGGNESDSKASGSTGQSNVPGGSNLAHCA
jgi:hypothetical protein